MLPSVYVTCASVDITVFPPSSIDDYFQESRQCGRSGDRAKSVIFWSPRDCPLKNAIGNPRDFEVDAVRHYVENGEDVIDISLWTILIRNLQKRYQSVISFCVVMCVRNYSNHEYLVGLECKFLQMCGTIEIAF